MAEDLDAFKGVFVPTSLTILGVILFLRLGYIVGSAGIIGTVLIILLAMSVTVSTGLSLSSIITDIKVGAGGAYSIISKTLGLEVGGSVGIPLYLAQTLSVTLYIFGFTEAWQYVFPGHPRVFVLLGVFFLVSSLAVFSTDWAMKTQVFVFALIIASLLSVFAGGQWWSQPLQVPFNPTFGSDFWSLFALFFPAVTGLMAGVGMSGELSHPKDQIPKGVLSAVGFTAVVYLAMVFWFGHSAGPEALTENTLIIVDLAAFRSVVIAGILAATFSSALTTLVAAPRILQALGSNSVLPWSDFFAEKHKGEPRNAVGVTIGIVALTLLFKNLNSVAPALTMFFLLTYGMINLVVYIEQSLGLVSFRPTLSIPKYIPLYGAVSSIVFMVYINVIAGLVALGFLFFTYSLLVRRRLEPKHGDVRSGLFMALAEWAAKQVIQLPESTEHIWKPNILLPATDTETLLGSYPLIKSIVYPNGTLSVLGMRVEEDEHALLDDLEQKEQEYELSMLPNLVDKFGKDGIFTNYSEVNATDYVQGLCVSTQAIEGQFFHPNTLFVPAGPEQFSDDEVERVVKTATKERSGLIWYAKHRNIGLGSEDEIHVWIPDEIVEYEDLYSERPFDLALLIAYRLQRNWSGTLYLRVCTSEEDRESARYFLKKLLYEARFSGDVRTSTKSYEDALHASPKGDVHIVPFRDTEELRETAELTEDVERTFLFVMDSGKEDVLA